MCTPLDWTLFTQHQPCARLRRQVEDGIASSAGLVYFGSYAQSQLTDQIPAVGIRPAQVIPLPTTIPEGTDPWLTPALAEALKDRRAEAITVSLCGFAAPWKDIEGLLQALERTTAPMRIVLAGPFWDDPAQAGCDLRAAVGRVTRLGGAAEFAVVSDYLDPPARAALVTRSQAGIFPYRTQPTFQGSGAIADYLAAGRPVIATDVANMAELVADAGLVVPARQPGELANALDRFTFGADERTAFTTAARTRASNFTPAAHARQCLDFYLAVTRRTPSHSRSG
jgi:glycosyltransferase involved in cell wall biosynthesis